LFAASSGDCDDTSNAVWPGASETCDSLDNDCDGQVDEGATDASTWYADADGDGHGGPLELIGCAAPGGYLSTSDDCNDTDPTSYPGADELCDSADNDCDGIVDNSAVDQATWYADDDGDLFGDDSTSDVGCSAPVGFVNRGGDCDDGNSTIRPGQPEDCNGLDDNCDGTRDDGLTQITVYADSDGDSAGDPDSTLSVCAAPIGYTMDSSDCDDSDPAVEPGAVEECDDGIDNNCDSDTDCEDYDNCKSVEDYCWECQDDVVDPDEECDDGNDIDGDGCDRDCQNEFSQGCAFQEAEHPGYTNIARDVVLCGNYYTSSNIQTACATNWHVCLESEWQARYPKNTAPLGTLTSYGASQGSRCPGGVWEAGRPNNTNKWGNNVCDSAYNPWNSGKYMYANNGSTIIKGSGSCCNWDNTFSANSSGNMAVYCCQN